MLYYYFGSKAKLVDDLTREANAEVVRSVQSQYQAGKGTPRDVAQSVREWADALANEYQAIVAYNNALVGMVLNVAIPQLVFDDKSQGTGGKSLLVRL